MHPPQLTRFRLPPAPEQPPRPGFPWIASIAPVVASVALWAVTGSVFGLMFALLGPIVAVAGVLDAARSRRRSGRRESARFAEACAIIEGRIADAHAAERGRLEATTASGWDGDTEAVPVRVGTGTVATTVEVTGDDLPDPSPLVAEHHARLRRAALEPPPGPVVLEAGAGLAVLGPPVLAGAVLRAVALRLAGALSPVVAELSAPAGEAWVEHLPHARRAATEGEYRWHLRDREIVLAQAEHSGLLPAGCGTVVVLGELDAPSPLGQEAAARAADELARRAAALGLDPAREALPASVRLAEVLPAEPGPGLAAPLGRDAHGVLVADLVAEGPHALVAGTTGSGKSELLVSWVLAMAHGRSPAEVAFLLIDFKGGAAFAPLASLPHVVGTLSDLDARLTHRAVLSLRAELVRRERVLAAARARSIDDLPSGALARLVIVVDEFAALVAGGPDLQDVFADLAARGRSLGLHLVLCTQRPAGVVRDAVLANIGLRLSLRVTDRADAVAILGDDAAARLPADPRGRAIVQHDAAARVFQVALATTADAVGIAAAADRSAAGPPWCDPLPEHLDLDALPSVESGWAFGLVDLPAEQRQPVAALQPRHGSLLVMGAARSGVTTALRALGRSAGSAGVPVTLLASDPADAWAQLETMPGGLLVADDLDLLLGRFGDEHRHEFAARLGALLRGGPARVLAGVRRLEGDIARLAPLFGSRLLLRQGSREEHLLAGGSPAAYDPAAPAGSGLWDGEVVQVAVAAGGVRAGVDVPGLVRVTGVTHPRIAVVSARPAADRERLTAGGWRVQALGDEEEAGSTEPVAVLGDPDQWNAHWARLAAARRDAAVVLRGCTIADHRALLPGRPLPPPLGDRDGECWLATPDGTVRARITTETVVEETRDG
ncbi:MAG TPA: FtsK/SpoIIIE domain-containing protein [Pseudolysinimonas sp.]|nr:FtsK/SpoIIIE domain-containing protein [Pseudolysinimonas sp.]